MTYLHGDTYPWTQYHASILTEQRCNGCHEPIEVGQTVYAMIEDDPESKGDPMIEHNPCPSTGLAPLSRKWNRQPLKVDRQEPKTERMSFILARQRRI